jgi:sulfate adenylyltransferase subunit 1 (EFTu-like GTPase family)
LSENPISFDHHSVSFASFRGVSGTVTQGQVKGGDEIRVTLSGKTTRVAELMTADGRLRLTQQRLAATDVVHAISG